MRKAVEELERYRRRGARVDGNADRVDRNILVAKLQRFGRRCGIDIADFKSAEQELVVFKVLEDEDVLAIMPTGSGKSLTYQFPAHCRFEAVTLVVSPLKVLMSQHAEIPGAVRLDSDTQIEDRPEVWDDLKTGRKFILLVSPEMLAKQLDRIAKLPLGRFVVDEVHCLSDWGHDFRPHYWWVSHFLYRLEKMRGRGKIPRLLLTATANERVLKDVARHFPEVQYPSAHISALLGREEILLAAHEVTSPQDRLRALVRFLKRQRTRDLPPGTSRRGIIFNLEAVGGRDDLDPSSSSRWKANQVVSFLKEAGFSRTYSYTSRGMNMNERLATLEAFKDASPRRGQVTIVVATNAFGMGMDFQRIPFVAHLYPRPSLSEYWQQVGRAGRGFEDTSAWAETLALYDGEDELYALRFAKAPALDGLVNAFTIPLHGWMYVWKKGGAEMCLEGDGGGKTRFSYLLACLQEIGLVAATPKKVTVPRNTIRYRVDLGMLRRSSTGEALVDLREGRFQSSKRLRKVFRYLAIAARSKEREYILLDQTDYSEDKYGTVLQRLNRWVDLGLLERDHRETHSGYIRLMRVGANLVDSHISKIAENGEEWANHKRRQVAELMDVLRARSPAERRRRILKHFGEKASHPQTQFDVPSWLHR